MKYTHEQLMFAAQVAQLAEAKASSARQTIIAAVVSTDISAEQKNAFCNRANNEHTASHYYSAALKEILSAASYVDENLG